MKINRSYLLCFFFSWLIVLCLYSNFLSLIIYAIAGVNIRISALKDILLCAIFILVLSSKNKINYKSFFVFTMFFLFSTLLLISLFISEADVYYKVMNVRYIILPLMYLYVFINGVSFIENKHFNFFKRFMTFNVFFMMSFCIVELLFRNTLWNVLNLKEFWSESNLFTEIAVEDMSTSGRLVSYDLMFLVGDVVPRLIGPVLDPAVLSFLLLSLIIWGAWMKEKKITQIMLFLFLIMTFSKNVILLVGMTPLIYLVYILFKRYVFLIPFIMLFSFLTLSAILVNYGFIFGAFSHTTGLYTGVLGSSGVAFDRLGLAGNIVDISNSLYANELFSDGARFIKADGVPIVAGAESAFGGIAAQLGMIPALLWLGIISYLIASMKNNKNSLLLVFIWLVSVFNNQAAFNSTTLPVLIFICSLMAKKIDEI